MKITKIILLLTLFINTSCGYKPIYLKNDQLMLEFNKIVSIGDQRLNKKIINTVGLLESEFNESLNELSLETNFDIEETSKNTKGQVETYRSVINVKLTIKKDEKILKSKNFLKEFSYNNKDNKFELTQYQSEIKNNLINKSSEEILLFLNLL